MSWANLHTYKSNSTIQGLLQVLSSAESSEYEVHPNPKLCLNNFKLEKKKEN